MSQNEEQESIKGPLIFVLIIIPLFAILMFFMVSGKLSGKETYLLNDVTYVQYIPQHEAIGYGFGQFKTKSAQEIKLYLSDTDANSMVINQNYNITYVDRDCCFPFDHKVTKVNFIEAVRQ